MWAPTEAVSTGPLAAVWSLAQISAGRDSLSPANKPANCNEIKNKLLLYMPHFDELRSNLVFYIQLQSFNDGIEVSDQKLFTKIVCCPLGKQALQVSVFCLLLLLQDLWSNLFPPATGHLTATLQCISRFLAIVICNRLYFFRLTALFRRHKIKA